MMRDCSAMTGETSRMNAASCFPKRQYVVAGPSPDHCRISKNERTIQECP